MLWKLLVSSKEKQIWTFFDYDFQIQNISIIWLVNYLNSYPVDLSWCIFCQNKNSTLLMK